MTLPFWAMQAGPPIVVYLLLCLLPRGWPFWGGCFLALLAMGVLYLRALGAENLPGQVQAMALGVAIALAGLAQTLRQVLPARFYPLVVIGLLAIPGAGLYLTGLI
jgi:hypothetical protein